ncbi:amidohydrolase family protein [Tessaracoccus caeni]|uniref:amidohydrolase family protein n=1 Tax=Tessaracoccus caeni TaxID=3031239 RepID=UPI0023DC24D8|nr:amidohydrolase family protein [Tessaracoccus caeni]MDF1488677.1 amidohydrolase family protein [Tessaracoccus caeni]
MAAGFAAVPFLASCANDGGTDGGSTPDHKESGAGISASPGTGEFDLVIAGAFVSKLGQVADVAIKDGKIAEVGTVDPKRATEVVSGEGKFLAPSFVDTHTHLDKALLWDDDAYRADVKANEEAWYASDQSDGFGYSTAGMAERAYMARLIDAGTSQADIVVKVKERMTTVIDWAIARGTGTIKTHTTWGEIGVQAITELKEEYAGRIDLKAIVPWSAATEKESFTQLTRTDYEKYVENGQVDFIGGYFSVGSDLANIDSLFAFAESSGLPVDLHVNEQDTPDFTEYNHILDHAIRLGLGDKLSCGHLTALDALGVDQNDLDAVIAKAARSGSNVISLPSCNMFLMGRKQEVPRRRGTTRLDLFLKNGVNTAFASDNIRDAWRPYGNADLLQEALVGSHVMQYAYPEDLEKVFDMITYNPARNAGLEGYGVGVGCNADLVLLDTDSAANAILTQAARIVVVKAGAIVARDGALV